MDPLTPYIPSLPARRPSPPAFHPFPHLPPELRFHIWSLAPEPRILRIHSTHDHAYWTPSPAPALTRVCRESRRHSGYTKAFTPDSATPTPYIWTHFRRDVVQVQPTQLWVVSKCAARDEMQYLRIDLSSSPDPDSDPEEQEQQQQEETQALAFHAAHASTLPLFPALRAVDILVPSDLASWTSFIPDTHWGACPIANVRVVCVRTGEWIDARSSGVYADWLEYRAGERREFSRIAADEDDEDEDEDEEDENGEGTARLGRRIDAVRRFKGLPRMACVLYNPLYF